MKQETLDETLVEKCYEITQGLSNDNKKHNFRCPCCGLTRIAKAKTDAKDDWNHTGCRCTYSWLSAHKKLVV